MLHLPSVVANLAPSGAAERDEWRPSGIARFAESASSRKKSKDSTYATYTIDFAIARPIGRRVGIEGRPSFLDDTYADASAAVTAVEI